MFTPEIPPKVWAIGSSQVELKLTLCRHHSITKMKHLAAYLLLGLAGKTSPSADDVKGVLESVGIDADEERLEKLISELDGKDINTV